MLAILHAIAAVLAAFLFDTGGGSGGTGDGSDEPVIPEAHRKALAELIDERLDDRLTAAFEKWLEKPGDGSGGDPGKAGDGSGGDPGKAGDGSGGDPGKAGEKRRPGVLGVLMGFER